ncbi:MAG: hypothetical protein OPY06_00015 [Nitrosopumilus sp.]|nr:hypothetical protein [Nitrosopumilus sp.]
MKNLPWILAICTGTLAGHSYIHQQHRIHILEQNLSLSDQARKIDSDQIRDLFYANQQLNAEKESISTRSYVSGVASVIDNKEHFDKIWHDGYDRGTEVQMLAYKSEEESKAISKIKEDLNLYSPLDKK